MPKTVTDDGVELIAQRDAIPIPWDISSPDLDPIQRYELGPLRVSGRLPPWHPQVKALEPAMPHLRKLDIPLPEAGVTVTGALATSVDGGGWVEFTADGLIPDAGRLP